MFKIMTGNYLELLTPETLKLLESNESKITTDKNGENVPNLEITEVVLVYWISLTVAVNKIQESWMHLFLINCLVNY